MPPQMMAVEEDEESPEVPQEPYRDTPDTPPRDAPRDTPRERERNVSGVASASALSGERGTSSDSDSFGSGDEAERANRVSQVPPMLGPIETGGGIELPSRIGSRASRVTQRGPPSRAPTIPRKNSRRTRSTEAATLPDGRLSTVLDASAPTSPQPNQHLQPGGLPIRLPFGSSEPSPERSPGHSAASSIYRQNTMSDLSPPPIIGVPSDRPLSTGYVQHHMTKDSLQSDGYDAGSHLEASAEIVDRSRSGSTQRSGRSYNH